MPTEIYFLIAMIIFASMMARRSRPVSASDRKNVRLALIGAILIAALGGAVSMFLFVSATADPAVVETELPEDPQ